MGYQPFIIMCDPRSGSTLLHTYLNSNIQIHSYGELGSDYYFAERIGKKIFVPHAFFLQAVGLKWFYEVAVKKDVIEFKKISFQIKNLKIINLERKNKLEAFVSLKIAERHQVWSSTSPESSFKKRITIDLNEFDNHLNEMKTNKMECSKYLANHEVLTISYEELVAAPEDTLAKVQSFLGVKSRRLFTLLKKQNPETLDELVSNYEQLKEHYPQYL
jgi:LPS sulfotransferase NodH